MTLFKLALKEIRHNLRFSLFFIFNLALGLSGLVAIDSLKMSIRDVLDSKAKGLLAADLEVGARRPLTAAEEKILADLLPAGTEKSQVFESFTMVASPTNTRLVEVKAIENNYPFYGDLTLEKAGLVNSASPKDIFASANVWVYPELLIQLDLSVGDKLTVGNSEFTISDTIQRDSSSAGAGFSFAPPIYISKENFAKTGLMKTGSTGYFSHLLKLPRKVEIEEFARLVNKELTDPAIKVTTSRNASEQVGRLLDYLSDYLGLAGLVALFLMALGQIFLYRGYLVKRYADIAIFKSLGLENSRVFKLYFIHVLMLGTFALVPALLFAALIMPILSVPAQELVNMEIHVHAYPSSLVLLVVLSLIGNLFICGPLLYQAMQTRPLELLKPSQKIPSAALAKTALLYLPAILAYYLISLWLAKSFVNGSLFFALFFGAIGLLVVVGLGLLKTVEKIKFSSLALRLASRNFSREQFATLAAFLTLGLGVLLTNLIPIIEEGIKSEIAAPQEIQQPSLFLVDVQDEQIEPLNEFLRQNRVNVMQASPLIRARLLQVNGEPFEKGLRPGESLTREQENENRFRNRGFNITYRKTLSESERVIAGQMFDDSETQLPKISLEVRFADRLGLKIGDRLTFDIQGVQIEGEVVNLRKVRWTSFQPNFFIQFEDGVLQDAPKTFLSTLGPLPFSRKIEIQTAIVKRFPNISIIDVSRVIERLLGIMTQMSLALRVMAVFSMVVGLTILFSIASHQIYARRHEVNLLKILGCEFYLIRRIFLYEFSLIALAAALFGCALSFVISFFLAKKLFDSAMAFPLIEPFFIMTATLTATGAITLLVIQNVLKSQPRELLQTQK